MIFVYLLLPWIILIVINFLIQPTALYAAGKIMKINNPNFKFSTCIWINFVAALIAGLLGGINIFLSLAAYVLLLGYLMKKQFMLATNTLAIMIVIMLGISIGMNYLQQNLVLLLLTGTTNSLQSINTNQSLNGSTQVAVLPPEDVCKLLSNEQATQIVGVTLHGSKSGLDMCVYSDDAKENYLYITYYRIHSDMQEKAYYLNDSYSKWNVETHDEIQKDAFLASQDALMKVFFMVNDKHYLIERSNSETAIVTDKVLLSLAKAVLEGSSNNSLSNTQSGTEQVLQTQEIHGIKRN